MVKMKDIESMVEEVYESKFGLKGGILVRLVEGESINVKKGEVSERVWGELLKKMKSKEELLKEKEEKVKRLKSIFGE
jgi:hypothetical protein